MGKKSLITSLKIQIIISFSLIVLGILVYNLLQISSFNSHVSKDPKNKTNPIPTISKKKSILAKSEKKSPTLKSYNLARFTIDENYPENIEEPKFDSLPDTKPDEGQKEVLNRTGLNDFRYDGYMRVGNSEIIWITKGAERISASEGSIITDNVIVEEIHENYLVVKDRNTNIRQNIPFTGAISTNTTAYNKSNVTPKTQTNLNINNTYAQTQRAVINDRNKNTISSTERPTNVNTRRDKTYDMPPQIPLDDAPPMPW